MNRSELDRSLSHIAPDDIQCKRIEILRDAGKELGTTIFDTCNDGRYRALAISRLEEAIMWAVKSIVMGE